MIDQILEQLCEDLRQKNFVHLMVMALMAVSELSSGEVNKIAELALLARKGIIMGTLDFSLELKDGLLKKVQVKKPEDLNLKHS